MTAKEALIIAGILLVCFIVLVHGFISFAAFGLSFYLGGFVSNRLRKTLSGRPQPKQTSTW